MKILIGALIAIGVAGFVAGFVSGMFVATAGYLEHKIKSAARNATM